MPLMENLLRYFPSKSFDAFCFFFNIQWAYQIFIESLFVKGFVLNIFTWINLIILWPLMEYHYAHLREEECEGREVKLIPYLF